MDEKEMRLARRRWERSMKLMCAGKAVVAFRYLWDGGRTDLALLLLIDRCCCSSTRSPFSRSRRGGPDPKAATGSGARSVRSFGLLRGTVTGPRGQGMNSSMNSWTAGALCLASGGGLPRPLPRLWLCLRHGSRLPPAPRGPHKPNAPGRSTPAGRGGAGGANGRPPCDGRAVVNAAGNWSQAARAYFERVQRGDLRG
jgi:hypothetical protein